MDPIVTTLLGSGPIGILAVVLLYLHTSDKKVFREEMKQERELFASALKEEREQCNQHHRDIMGAIQGIRCQGKQP